jgi:hypothetical protein
MTTETEPSTLPVWVVPGGDVYELHCTTRGYRTIKRILAEVAHVTSKAVVLTNGARYSLTELAAGDHATFHRDDPQSAARYYLLVGPDDPRGMEKP